MNRDDTPKLTRQEILETISRLKLNKAPGPDGIKHDMLKDFGEILAGPLASLFNTVTSLGLAPSQWYKAEIILLHKKGDRADINNYRPISLSSNACKLFMKLSKIEFIRVLFHI